MNEPQIISFSPGGQPHEDMTEVELVEDRRRESKIVLVVDRAGELCLKTPRAVPLNEE